MNNPQITVLTPVYNGEKYLKEMINSIFQQTLQDFEFIIVNDGSTDNSEEIIKSYNDPRICYVANTRNSGISFSYNRAIKLSRGEFLAVAEQDDISHPRRLEIQVDYMRKHDTVGMVSAVQKSFTGAPPPFDAISGHPRPSVNIRQWKYHALLLECGNFHASSMYRKSTLMDNAICYDEKRTIAVDIAIFLALSRVTEIARLDCHLLSFRVHCLNHSKDITLARKDENEAYRNFFRSEFELEITGDCIWRTPCTTQEQFSQSVKFAKHILSHVGRHPDYDSDLLGEVGGEFLYKQLRSLMRSGMSNKQAFLLSRKTPLLDNIDRAKKLRLWCKYIAYYFGIQD